MLRLDTQTLGATSLACGYAWNLQVLVVIWYTLALRLRIRAL